MHEFSRKMKSNIHRRVAENTERYFFLQQQVLFAHRRLPMDKKEKSSVTSVPLW